MAIIANEKNEYRASVNESILKGICFLKEFVKKKKRKRTDQLTLDTEFFK